MPFDYSPYQDLVDWALSEYGESVTYKRLTIDYAAVPPTETWTLTGTVWSIVQPLSGHFLRSDPGRAAGATHRILAAFDSGIFVGDRIFRAGDTNYYEVQIVEDWEVLFQITAKYCKGAL
jgi:hypothetical protein